MPKASKTTTPTTKDTSAAIAQLSTDTTALENTLIEAQHTTPLANWTGQTIDIAQALSKRISELAHSPDLTPSDIGKLAAANKVIYELGKALSAPPARPTISEELAWIDNHDFEADLKFLHARV